MTIRIVFVLSRNGLLLHYFFVINYLENTFGIQKSAGVKKM